MAPAPTATAVPVTSLMQPVLGWYSGVPTSAARLTAERSAGENLVVSYYSPALPHWLQLLQHLGLHALVQPDPRWIAAGDRAALVRWVRRIGEFTAVAGWYLYDEPDRSAIAPVRLRAAYRTIKRLDQRPVAMVFASNRCQFGAGELDPAYLPAFDLLLFDVYPFYRNLATPDPLALTTAVTAECARTARRYHKAGPIMVLQGFGRGTHDGPFRWRDPSYRESLCSTAAALGAGASGVLFWNDRAADMHVWSDTQTVLRRVREARSLPLPSGDRCSD